MYINKLSLAFVNLIEYANKLLSSNSGKLSFSNLGEYEFVDNDYSTSFKILTFADDKQARKADLKNIGNDLKIAVQKYNDEHNGEG